MRLAYMVATPEVTVAPVTALRGDLAENLRRLAAVGFQGVELTVVDPGRFDADAVLGAARAAGLPVAAICTGEVYGQEGLSFCDPNPAIRAAALERTLRILALAERCAAAVNIGRLRGRLTAAVPREQSLSWLVEALRRCARAYPAVPILLEPINHAYANFIRTTPEGQEVVRQVGEHNVRLQLDLVHMRAEGEDPAASFALAGPDLAYVHLADSERRSPGLGVWEFASVRRALDAVGYRGWVSVEAWQEPDQATAVASAAAALLPLFAT